MLKNETWPIEKFVEYVRNPRKNDHVVDRIAAAIREFGFRVPMIVKSDGTIVDGHLRLKAAKKIGLTELPVVLADDLTPQQVKAFRLSVNKMAELAGWDEGMLRLELRDLGDMGFDLELIGFGLDEVGMTDPSLDEMPNLPDGDKEPFQQKTFTLHDDQAAIVDDALTLARTDPTADTGINENSNGNALSLICKQWLAQKTSS